MSYPNREPRRVGAPPSPGTSALTDAAACGKQPPYTSVLECGAMCRAPLGGRITALAAGATATVTITPGNFERAAPRELVMAASDTALGTPINNVDLISATIKGNDQLGGGVVPIFLYSPEMPELGIGWDIITPQNPLTMEFTNNSAVAVDIQIGLKVDGLR